MSNRLFICSFAVIAIATATYCIRFEMAQSVAQKPVSMYKIIAGRE